MSLDGFYKVDFSAALPGVGGIVTVEDGTVRGGDDQFIYAGTLTRAADDALSATISVQGYAPHAQSVFGGAAQRFSLELSGQKTGDGFELFGTANLPGVPNISIRASKIGTLGLTDEAAV